MHYSLLDYSYLPYLSAQDAAWETRKQRLLLCILSLRPDALCLQEVDAAAYNEWFAPELQRHGYTGHYLQRGGDKADGCAIFVKKDVFEVVQCIEVPLLVPQHVVLDKDNVCLVLVIKHAATGRRIVLVNLHLVSEMTEHSLLEFSLNCALLCCISVDASVGWGKWCLTSNSCTYFCIFAVNQSVAAVQSQQR
jgi:Endonuclease/Exonuclease/phosphatase family